MKRYNVRPSVAQPAGYIDRLMHSAPAARHANAGSATLSAYIVAQNRVVLEVPKFPDNRVYDRRK